MTSVLSKGPSRELIGRINQEHALAVRGREAYETHARRCGTALIAAKKLVNKHGEWMPWVEKHCEFSQGAANEYMQLAGEESKSNSRSHVNLPPRTQAQIRTDRRAARPPREAPSAPEPTREPLPIRKDAAKALIVEWRMLLKQLQQLIADTKHVDDRLSPEAKAFIKHNYSEPMIQALREVWK